MAVLKSPKKVKNKPFWVKNFYLKTSKCTYIKLQPIKIKKKPLTIKNKHNVLNLKTQVCNIYKSQLLVINVISK